MSRMKLMVIAIVVMTRIGLPMAMMSSQTLGETEGDSNTRGQTAATEAAATVGAALAGALSTSSTDKKRKTDKGSEEPRLAQLAKAAAIQSERLASGAPTYASVGTADLIKPRIATTTTGVR